MSAELDLTAAIHAVEREMLCSECPMGGTCGDCLAEAKRLIEVALPYIREVLAQQIEASVSTRPIPDATDHLSATTLGVTVAQPNTPPRRREGIMKTTNVRPTPWEVGTLAEATGRLHDILASADWDDQHDGIQQEIDAGKAALVKLEAALTAAFDRAAIRTDMRRDDRNRANVAAMLTQPNEDQLERRAEHARDARADSLAAVGCAS